MKFEFDMSDFNRKLEQLQDDLSSIDGREIPLTELLDPPFMAAHTQFQSIDDMFEEAGLQFETQEEFENLGEDVLDDMVRGGSEFSTWTDMKNAAATHWLRRHLGTDTDDE